MAEPFLGQVAMVGFNFAPRGWALCNGQLLAIQQNAALFALIGTYYGGNGTSTFALPDLRGRAPIHQGTGGGLSTYVLGETVGTETVTLASNNLPQHAHTPAASTTPNPATALSPQGNVWGIAGTRRVPASLYMNGTFTAAPMNPAALGPVGGNGPHNNRQPYLGITFVIALVGIFPSRN